MQGLGIQGFWASKASGLRIYGPEGHGFGIVSDQNLWHSFKVCRARWVENFVRVEYNAGFRVTKM